MSMITQKVSVTSTNEMAAAFFMFPNRLRRKGARPRTGAERQLCPTKFR